MALDCVLQGGDQMRILALHPVLELSLQLLLVEYSPSQAPLFHLKLVSHLNQVKLLTPFDISVEVGIPYLMIFISLRHQYLCVQDPNLSLLPQPMR